MGSRTLRVGSWNLSFGRGSPSLVADKNFDVLLLQEVKQPAYEKFRELFADGVYSIGPSLRRTEPAPSHGVAVLWSDRLVSRGAQLLEYVVAPHRFLVCDLAFVEQRGYLRACSYHALNGEQGEDRFDKPRFTYQVARWLEDQPLPVIIGMDANSPAVDHPDFQQTRCHFDWLGLRHFERALLGPEARHRLSDVWRVWIDQHPEELDAIRRDRPKGPLAVSHRTGRTSTRAGNPQRFDHILATSGDFEVIDAAYHYDEACAAGSDHALVDTVLEVRLDPGERSAVDTVLPTALS